MADGNRQQSFGFPQRALASALRPGEIVLDFFADCAVVTAFLEQANGGGPNGNPARARAAIARANLDPTTVSERIAA